VAHAVRTDPAFAQRLRAAEAARAVRPARFADIGRRGWHAASRTLNRGKTAELLRRRSTFDRWLASRQFRRAVRRIVRQTIESLLSEAPPLESQSGNEQST
jgi:hypothetical protein